MNAVARTVTAIRGSASEPVVTVTAIEYCSPDQYDREYLLDAAAAGSRDAYSLCGKSELVQAICDDYGLVAFDSSVHKDQRDRERQRAQSLEDDIATERNRHQVTVLDLETARERLADVEAELMVERAEVARLQTMNAKLSAQLAETSHRLIDVSFDHATCVIAKLQAERQTSQCMLFDTSDTTVVDVEVP